MEESDIWERNSACYRFFLVSLCDMDTLYVG